MEFGGQVEGQQFGSLALHALAVLQEDLQGSLHGVPVGPGTREEVAEGPELRDRAVLVDGHRGGVQADLAERRAHDQHREVRRVEAGGGAHRRALPLAAVDARPGAPRRRRVQIHRGGHRHQRVALERALQLEVGDLGLVAVAERSGVHERRVGDVDGVLQHAVVVGLPLEGAADGPAALAARLGHGLQAVEGRQRRPLGLGGVTEEDPHEAVALHARVRVDAGLAGDRHVGPVGGDPHAAAVAVVRPAVVRALQAAVGDPAAGQRAAAVHAQVGLRNHGPAGGPVQHEVVAVDRHAHGLRLHRRAELDGVPLVLDEHVNPPWSWRRRGARGGGRLPRAPGRAGRSSPRRRTGRP